MGMCDIRKCVLANRGGDITLSFVFITNNYTYLYFSMMTEAKTECIAATIRSYNNKAGATTYLEHMYRMTTDCFIESANHTHLTSCRTPDTGNFDDIIPVTSKTTGTAYWNRACAACNDDDNDIIVWTPSVIFKIVMPYFGISRSMGIPPFPDTFEKLNTFVRVPRQGELIYKPPLSMEDSVCVRKDSIYMDFCKPPSDRNNHVLQEWLSDACDKFYSPIYGTVQPFMNIFCYICQAKIEPNGKESNCRRIFGRGGIGFTALLNYKRDEGKSEDDGEDDLIDENESCGCTEIYDPHLVR